MYSFGAVSAAYQYEVGRDADTVFTLCSRLYNREKCKRTLTRWTAPRDRFTLGMFNSMTFTGWMFPNVSSSNCA